MSPSPLLKGPIPQEGPSAVLREVERRRTTGVLRFQGGGISGEVELLRGQVAEVQPGSLEVIEAWLGLHEGSFEVFQRLPPLPVSRGDENLREGRLGVHTPADLMNYCERAGLTGALFLARGERQADFLYDAGELTAVRLFGDDDGEVQQVFAWEEGDFRVEAWPAMPELPEPRKSGAQNHTVGDAVSVPDPGKEGLLRVVEVTLSSLLASPALRMEVDATPMPQVVREDGEHATTRRGARADPTVRVIYLGPPSRVGCRDLSHPLAKNVAEAGGEIEAPVMGLPSVDPTHPDPSGPASLRGDPTIRTEPPPAPPEPTSSDGLRGHAFFGDAGPLWMSALAVSVLVLLAAIAHPFLIE